MRNINYKKLFIALFVALIISIGLALIFFADSLDGYRSAKLSDVINDAVREEMDRQIQQTSSLSIALAGNESIAAALKNRDRKAALEAVDKIMSSFDTYDDNSKFWIQLHTPDLKVFMRSWNKEEFGAPLESFRKGLVYVKNSQKPFASIELGKKLNFKAIAPVSLGGEYVGSLEVIKNFDEAVKNFADKKISLLVLMDNKFMDIAEWMADYPILGDFIVCHREYDGKLFEELKNDDLYLFIGRKKTFSKSYFISTEPMRDLSGERLGFFVTAIPIELAKKMMKSGDDISFLFPVSKSELVDAYKNRDLVKSSLDIKRLNDIESKREILKNLSRDELEHMIIYGEKSEIKRGEIR